jgi:hypothetical protein
LPSTVHSFSRHLRIIKGLLKKSSALQEQQGDDDDATQMEVPLDDECVALFDEAGRSYIKQMDSLRKQIFALQHSYGGSSVPVSLTQACYAKDEDIPNIDLDSPVILSRESVLHNSSAALREQFGLSPSRDRASASGDQGLGSPTKRNPLPALQDSGSLLESVAASSINNQHAVTAVSKESSGSDSEPNNSASSSNHDVQPSPAKRVRIAASSTDQDSEQSAGEDSQSVLVSRRAEGSKQISKRRRFV